MSAPIWTMDAVRYWQPDLRSVRRDEWTMFDGSTRVAIIVKLTIGPKAEELYRSVTWAERSEDRVLIGYFPHLRMAAEMTWTEWRKASERLSAGM